MLVTLFGIVMLVNLLQRENAIIPMEVTLFGIVMLTKPVLANAPSRMIVTVLGRVMLVKLVQL